MEVSWTIQLNELSLDNIIDLQRADEIGNQIPIAGNVDPVQVVNEWDKRRDRSGGCNMYTDRGKKQKGISSGNRM